MQTADGKRFRELLRAMNRVLACESGAELDNPMLDVYWLALRDWSLEEFDQACTHLLKTATFMPKPAAFTALRKATGTTAGEAWARALEHARDLPASGGCLQEMPTGDALLDAAARTVGGFKAIANASERDLQFIAKRFDEHYAALLERDDVCEAVPLLVDEAMYNHPRRLA